MPFTKKKKFKKKFKKKIKENLISAPDLTLDIVYTYVDTTDSKWINKVKKYKPSFGNNLNKERFNYQGEIFFSLKTVEKFMPWVRNIFIVHDNQEFDVSFLKEEIKKKIKFIDHTDIIPKKYLPVFNSMLIELFLHKINGLSDFFIYLNDDCFLGNYITQDTFFNKNRIFKQFIRDRKEPYDINRINGEPHLIRLINVHNLVENIFKKKKYYISNHGPWNLNKNILKITFNIFKNIFEKMLKTQKFRTYNEDTYEFLTLSSIIAEELKLVKTINYDKKIYVLQRELNKKEVDRITRIKPCFFVINKLNNEQKTYWDKLRKNYLNNFKDVKYNNIVSLALKDNF